MEERGARRRHAPWFTAAWLGVTSLLYVLLADETGFVRGWPEALFFVPAESAAAPLTLLVVPLGMLLAHDVVQFAYVVAIYAFVVPAFEWREGWRRTAFVFLVGGLASALLVSFLVFAPLQLLAPDAALVANAWSRAYSGASTGVFAVWGALAAVAAAPRARWAILGGGLAWEAFIWWWYFRFAELIPLFHYAALALGFLLARTAAYRGLRG